jgi:hypothetical protein
MDRAQAAVQRRWSSASSAARTWGSTAADRARSFPADRFVREAVDVYFRAVEVAAPAPVVFRWLCQLRVAPYSYDLLDNLGRRSPRTLTPGLERLELGQRFMTIFELVDFEPDRQITLRIARLQRLFGRAAVTYTAVPVDEDRCRLVVKLVIDGRGPRAARSLRRELMPFGELVMMRRQLLTLRDLAERG